VNQHLHLSIGPVQAFVGQSRRTRDLWSSSYLLSFLSAHAVAGARKAGTKVLRPLVDDDPMLQWVEGHKNGEAPRFGSLPNQFTIEVSPTLDPPSIAEAAKRAFDTAWQRVCQAVWNRFVAGVANSGNGTREIWERQVNGFWELIWVSGEPEEHTLLARRKLWRTHWLPIEPGDKCTLMPDFQELSGYVRAIERERQEQFWRELRPGVRGLELQKEKERLCAIALVKRLYARPEVMQEAVGWAVDVKHWPSTVDIAAVPWLRGLPSEAAAQAEEFARTVAREAGPEVKTGGASNLLDPADANRAYAHLDANWFHRSFVANPRLALLSDEKVRAGLVEQLQQLNLLSASSTRGTAREGMQMAGGSPIYFALLLADGDNLGSLVQRLGPEIVSPALADFTAAGPKIIQRYHGATVYAGGDDLLALLPVEGGLECISEIEQRYRVSFERAARRVVPEATLSAAVVFAHARAPFPLVLAEAHRMLDNVAKDENGRDSLGISVYRGHQCAAQWTSTWRRGPSDSEYEAVGAVSAVMQTVREQSLSASAVHRIARTIATLCNLRGEVGSFGQLAEGFELQPFLRGELEQSTERQQPAPDPDHLAQLLDGLLRRSMRKEGVRESVSLYIGTDGLALAYFVAGGGREEEHRGGEAD
jgi:CRISPR-associated protein Cmr2